MPVNYARRLAGSQRSRQSNRQLGLTLTFVAGATNAGAFLAVHQYTSHMTGIVASMADNLALGSWAVFAAGVGALVSFLGGAACSAMLVNAARRRQLHSQFAGPLLLEAALLLLFGVIGASLAELHAMFVPLTVMLLCFTMGLQNAVITKMSHAEIRTTHITGIVTDLGIELGKLFYWNRMPPSEQRPSVRADRDKLMLLSAMLSSFFLGGVIGAYAFQRIGYKATVPLAVMLTALTVVPATDDLRAWLRRRWQ